MTFKPLIKNNLLIQNNLDQIKIKSHIINDENGK